MSAFADHRPVTGSDPARQMVLPAWVGTSPSLATSLISMFDGERQPLYPQTVPFIAHAGSLAGEAFHYPYEVGYAYERLPGDLFAPRFGSGLERWSPLLPPLLPGLSCGEGATPLVKAPQAAAWAGVPELVIKDESANPTWSHKDRLSLCTVSAAAAAGAMGTIISSSGNHGASAAAYSARAGLKCIVLCDDGVSGAHARQMRAYGAAVVAMPRAARWPLLDVLSHQPGWYLIGNTAPTHTGHPFGPEGYKTIAYELFLESGRVPAAVSIPTSYGELLFGIGKGFAELKALGLTKDEPMLIAAEPEGSAAIGRLYGGGSPCTLEPGETIAHGIGSACGSFRGITALRRSRGLAIAVSDQDIADAQAALGLDGLWSEPASAAGLAALRIAARQALLPAGPVVHISTSTGLKEPHRAACEIPRISHADWPELRSILTMSYHLPLD
ncbi:MULTISPECIES: threonine synthase [Bosea]|uniref:Threonine synthase n=1 Tax=Bosea robiniae TaxID=1036780 RepID=A0ABY0P1X5_9HYPH|nr:MULTISPECIES: pyridoxal-phosphate dependent enzyme [Bosea]TQI74183.1 threonine synthase [Bosea sp. AK1]SDG60364.1 threonine synthase [Bosea robiniae]